MKLKRMLSIALGAALLISCLLMGGCSTPANALEVDGKVYTTGDYLAYVYNTVNTDYTAYMYLYYYGADALSQTVSYDEDTEMTLEEYILQTAQDTMIRQKVLEDMLAENNLEWNAEELADLEENLKTLKTDAFISMGFNNERYINMVKAYSLNEYSLFYGLYGEGGSRAVSETDIRKYFDDNYLSYKSIEISLVNDDESELSEDEISAIQTRLQGYLNTFNAGEKTGAGFDKVYAQYVADEEAAAKTEDTDTTTDTTTEAEEEPTATRNDIVAEQASDEDLVKAIQAVEEGSAGIQTYLKNGTTKTMALIFRMDPEAERTETTEDEDGNEVTTAVDYYAEQKNTILQYMKYEEFDAEVQEKIDALGDKIVRHKRALNAPDLEEMLGLE